MGPAQFDMKLVAPHNRRRFKVIVIGTGLAGGAAAADARRARLRRALLHVPHDSPRRAHSIAAQGGINAAKNYKGDGDSIFRLFYDTVKGGDFRAREGNVYRLAPTVARHHRPVRGSGCAVRPRVRGLLDNRSFGGAQVKPHVLRPRPDRAAAVARGVPSPRAADRQRHRHHVPALGDARARGEGRPGVRHRRSSPAHGRSEELQRARRRRARHRWVRQRLLPVDEREGVQRHRHLEAHRKARCSPTRASRRSTRRASLRATTSSRS